MTGSKKPPSRIRQAPAFELAKQYWNGNGIPSDPEQAIVWFTKAAQNNDVQAQRALAFIYSVHGAKKGIKPDDQKAFYWANKAARYNDDPSTRLLLGTFYISGKGTAVDEKKGLLLLKEAAEKNYPQAMAMLGEFYLEKKDRKVAQMWFKRAAASGDQKVIEIMKKKGVYPQNPVHP